MFIRLTALLALLLPAAALAQVAPKNTAVEIIATGQFDAPASAYVLTGAYSAEAADEAGARKAQAEKQAAVRAALKAAGVPDTALTLTPGTDFTQTESITVEQNSIDVDVLEDENAAVPDPFVSEPLTSVTDSFSIRVSTFEQATAVRRALMEIDVPVAQANAVLDDPEGARRRAKTMAIDNARADAMAYAKALGMHIVRVVRISETGNGLFLPGFQSVFQRMISGGGPDAMKAMFESRPGFVHVEATIIVEFELAP